MSSAVDIVRSRFISLLGSTGRALLSAQYPDDFEYYACSFELTDSQDKVIDMLVFPIMPESLNLNKQEITSIKKTAAGVVSLGNSTFVPFDISLNGTFGRKFRFLVGRKQVDASAIHFDIKKLNFSAEVKTGYGVTKVMHNLLQSAKTPDSNGQPHRLYFHNLAFNESYLVELLNHTYSQNREGSNMIWQYGVNLKAIAPTVGVRQSDSRKKMKDIMKIDNINKILNTTAKTVSEQLKVLGIDTIEKVNRTQTT